MSFAKTDPLRTACQVRCLTIPASTGQRKIRFGWNLTPTRRWSSEMSLRASMSFRWWPLRCCHSPSHWCCPWPPWNCKNHVERTKKKRETQKNSISKLQPGPFYLHNFRAWLTSFRSFYCLQYLFWYVYRSKFWLTMKGLKRALYFQKIRSHTLLQWFFLSLLFMVDFLQFLFYKKGNVAQKSDVIAWFWSGEEMARNSIYLL